MEQPPPPVQMVQLLAGFQVSQALYAAAALEADPDVLGRLARVITGLGDHPDQVSRFTGAMANLTNGIKRAALTSHDFSGSHRLVDVGGADGSVLAHVLATLPDATGVSYDLPHVVPAVPAVAKAADLGERLTGEPGDFFDSVPAGADTYVMSMILHDWDDLRATRILSNIAAAGTPGARVCALELVMPDGDEPHMAKMIDLTMLDGRERTEAEMRDLVESSGLRYERTVPTPTPLSFIEARVP